MEQPEDNSKDLADKMVKHMINSTIQRASFIAVICGVLTSCKDQATRITAAMVSLEIINTFPLNDDLDLKVQALIHDIMKKEPSHEGNYDLPDWMKNPEKAKENKGIDDLLKNLGIN